MAVGSTAVRSFLCGARRPAVVVEVLSAAVYLQVGPGTADGGAVVAVVTRDAVRVPLAVAIPAGAGERPFGAVPLGAPGSVGDGSGAGVICLPDGRAWQVTRWWDPAVPCVPAVPVVPTSPAVPAAAHAPVEAVEPVEAALASALADGGRGLDLAVAGLLGRGPGLTPEGDDVLAGALVALAAVGSPVRDRLAAAVETLLAGSQTRTTTVSAALLRCAVRGQAIPELARFLRTGDAAALLAVGHTSGAALARGALLAGAARPTPATATARPTTREEAA